MESNNRNHSKAFIIRVSTAALVLGLILGGFAGFCIGFVVLFLLFADGTSFYFLLKRYFHEPETVVLLVTTVSFALTVGIIALINSLQRLKFDRKRV
ncbi:hypothetical protein [Paradesulfitobacterium ferrireducens]|uniref:hypothetical protein n=1 Tax=Paradesulfitobacterium ferrireducens TaxID=2816476 RepID=UPI001A8FC9D2|nr:hypothetical protein [Paradesulfitobacterium ferrireducens]